MQFEINHKVGTDYSTVTFITGQLYRLPKKVCDNLLDNFFKLGGSVNHLINSNEFQFPAFITSEILEEVIHNTCFVCGGLMKDSTAMVDQEFKFEHDVYGTVTQQIPGYAKQIKVRKCSSCGHSHT